MVPGMIHELRDYIRIRAMLYVMSEEISNMFHVQLPLLVLRHVARFRECVPLDFRLNLLEERFDDTVLGLIVTPVEKQSWHRDLVKLRNDGPLLQRACYMELRRAIPWKCYVQRQGCCFPQETHIV